MEKDPQHDGSEGVLARLRRWNRGGGWGSRRWYVVSQGSFSVAMVMVVLGLGNGQGWVWYVMGALLVISTVSMIGGDLAARRRHREGWVPVEKEPWPMSLLTAAKWERPHEPQ